MSNIFEFDDEIISIEYIGEEDTIDIEVSGNHLFYANGILTHNSGVQEQDFDHSHVAGGISKINTADNVLAIFTTTAMKERGEYQIQFLKTRSSSGVGQKVSLQYDINTMRITDMPEGSEIGTQNTGASALMAKINKNKPQQSSEGQSGAGSKAQFLAESQISRIRTLALKGRD
jgi:hypothetical protein